MDTTTMAPIEKMTSIKAWQQLQKNKAVLQSAQEVASIAENAMLNAQVTEVVETNYDIGKVMEVWEIFGGYINRSFGIVCEKDGVRTDWFVRKYLRNKDIKEIHLEHDLLFEAYNNGCEMVTLPLLGNGGASYFRLDEGEGDEAEIYYYAVYHFIQGDVDYDWINNIMPERIYMKLGTILGGFHNSIRNFDPKGNNRQELDIRAMLPNFRSEFQGYLDFYEENGLENMFTKYYRLNFDEICRIAESIVITDEDAKEMPFLTIHNDFHPGNFKYNGDEVTGMFDFDWAKVDMRLFEIAFACTYCFNYWDPDKNGVFDMDAVTNFCNAYNAELRKAGGLTPLTDTEKRLLPEFLLAGNLYLVRWASQMVWRDLSLSEFEYLFYLQHQVTSLYWVRDNLEKIREQCLAIV